MGADESLRDGEDYSLRSAAPYGSRRGDSPRYFIHPFFSSPNIFLVFKFQFSQTVRSQLFVPNCDFLSLLRIFYIKTLFSKEVVCSLPSDCLNS